MSHCLGLFINYTGHPGGQLKAGQDKIFSDMLLLQMIFKLVCFHCLILQSAKYKQSPLPVVSRWCQGGEPEDMRTCSVVDNRIAGKGVKATGDERAIQDDTLLLHYLVETRGRWVWNRSVVLAFFFPPPGRVMNNHWNKICLQWMGVSDLKSLKPGQMSF